MVNKKKTLMIVLGKGGHTEQMLKLVDSLGEKYNYEYLIGKNDLLSPKRIKNPGRIFLVSNPREMGDKHFLIVFSKLFKTTIDSFFALVKSKTSIVVTCGPGLGIPVSFLAKFIFRKKIIFIESWSRVYSKSLTGKYLYPIADVSFVQWPGQKKNYPGAIYAGRFA